MSDVEDAAKQRFGTLIAAICRTFAGNGLPIERLRGIALYDSSKDRLIKSLGEFGQLANELANINRVQTIYGREQSERLALQLVYEYFKRTEEVRLDEALLESVWKHFTAELQTSCWTTRGVANLRYFVADSLEIKLGDGITILGRDPELLESLGFGPGVWDRLISDWGSFGSSSFVIVAESNTPKQPDNFINVDSSGVWSRCARALGALRLVQGGDLGMGMLLTVRAAAFNVGLGGLSGVGFTAQTLGTEYRWSESLRTRFESTYAALARLESGGYGKAPGNLDLALRAFMSTYDRWPTAGDSRLLDSVMALEALLGSETEIAFKLAFRVASLLADSDEERARLLRIVKEFYDTRSRIVHGGRLKTKQQEHLLKVDELRDLVRRLLVAFVAFAADDKRVASKGLFHSELDSILVDSRKREELRQLLALVDPQKGGSRGANSS
jgi:hypothetical protein